MNSQDLINELKWRGLISQTSGNLNELLQNPTTFYLGIDPTADSLGVHHIVGLMVSKILQNTGISQSYLSEVQLVR